MTQQQQQNQQSKSWILRTFAFVAIGAFILPIQGNNHIKANAEQTISKLLVKSSRKVDKPTREINSVSFSPDGKNIVTASDNSTVILWDVKTGKQIETPKVNSSRVRSVSFSPDGKMIASAGADNTIKLWNVKTGKQIEIPKVNSSGVRFTSFLLYFPTIASKTIAYVSSNGQTIASANSNKTIKLQKPDGTLKIAQIIDTKVIIGDQASRSMVLPKMSSTNIGIHDTLNDINFEFSTRGYYLHNASGALRHTLTLKHSKPVSTIVGLTQPAYFSCRVLYSWSKFERNNKSMRVRHHPSIVTIA